MREKQLLTQATTMECQPFVILDRIMTLPKCTISLNPILLHVKAIEDKTTSTDICLSRCEAKKPTPKLTKESFMQGLNLHPRINNKKDNIDNKKVPVTELTTTKLTRRRTLTETSTSSEQGQLPLSIQAVGRSLCSMLSPPTHRHTSWQSQNGLSYEPMEEDFSTSLNDSTGDVDNGVDDLVEIDLCSPLGQRLVPVIMRQEMQSLATVKHYDIYCNKTEIKIGNRCLRSKTDYCDDHWNMNNIHYVRVEGHDNINRTHEFGRRARQERFRRLKHGLNRRSRKLLRLIRPCSVVLDRVSYNEAKHCKGANSAVPQNPVEMPSSVDLVADENRASQVALASVFIDNPKNWQCKTPLDDRDSTELLTKQPQVDEKAVLWMDLVYDEPNVGYDLVDLTIGSDDEVVNMQLPSPTSILSTPPREPILETDMDSHPQPADLPHAQYALSWNPPPAKCSTESSLEKTKFESLQSLPKSNMTFFRKRKSKRIQKKSFIGRCKLVMMMHPKIFER